MKTMLEELVLEPFLIYHFVGTHHPRQVDIDYKPLLYIRCGKNISFLYIYYISKGNIEGKKKVIRSTLLVKKTKKKGYILSFIKSSIKRS
jgi:hypothetical protein